MITYILKAIIFSAFLLLIYRLFLEKEKMHRFNRFYLLLSIILSITAPLVSIETGSPVLTAFKPFITARNNLAGIYLTESFTTVDGQIESSAASNSATSNDIYGISSNYESVAENSHDITGSVNYKLAINSWEEDAFHGNLNNQDNDIKRAGESIYRKNNSLPGNLLLFVYLAVTTGLLFRFSRNIHAFSKKIRNNRSVPYFGAKLVLTRETIIPYSFLNYIFVNEDEYINGTIENAVLGHELTHIRQKHTLDILFFELVRIFGWINPFLPFYRNALRLNHEFLADDCVVKEYCDPMTYQYLLVKKIHHGSGMALSSPLNYLFTKKRLIMMNKKEASMRTVLKQVALIPVTGLATLLFLNITVAAGYGEFAGPDGGISNISVSESSSPQQKQNRTTTTQIQAPPPPFSDDFVPVPPTSRDLKAVQQPLYLVYIDGWIVENSILDYYEETDFAHHHVSKIGDRSVYYGEFDSTAIFYTHTYYRKSRRLDFEEYISPGGGVSHELLDEYERIINKYTPADMTGTEQTRNIRENISPEEKVRLREIYSDMTLEQRKEQRVIFLAIPVVSRNIPTVEQFRSLNDPELYGVWIDGERVDNHALGNYSHTGFSRMTKSRLMKNAVNYGKHVYQVNLMTHSRYEIWRDNFSNRYELMYRIRVNQDEASELQPTGAVQAGNSSWEVARRTDASGNEINEITGVFEGTMQSKGVVEAPLKVKIFVTNRRGGEMFTEFYEAGSEAPEKLYPEFTNYTKLIVYSRLPSGEIIEMEQTSGGSHMWDFYVRDVTPAGNSHDLRYGEPREGDFLNFILGQDEILNIRVQFHPATHKIYRFDIDPTGLKELFAGL